MRALIVADPIERLKPAGDSTLVIVREMLRRGYEIQWGLPAGLELEKTKVIATTVGVEECVEGELPRVGAADRRPVDSYDFVLIRKDPPFGRQYLRLCWLLALAEAKVPIINSPAVLLRYHEKLIPFEAVAHGFLKPSDLIPTYVGASERVSEPLLKEKGDRFVSKPFFGFGGKSVSLHERSAIEPGKTLPGLPGDLWQPFLPDIHVHGDRRVFFLNGKVLAHFVRVPSPGGFVSNLAQGGKAESRPLRAVEKRVLERLGKFLRKAGIVLAGADLIGAYISEVNVTSPTGLRSLELLDGHCYAEELLDYCEKRAHGKR